MVLYDPIKKKQRINVNGKKYFTPASNTKILTFYAAYKSLQDTLRTFVYRETADSLILRGTGDPGFLYGFNDSLALAFLQSKKQGIYLEDSKLAEPVFGDGWSWEDYPYYYMPEKSLFAMYGNVMKMEVKGDSVDFEAPYFANKTMAMDSMKVPREWQKNQFYYQKGKDKRYLTPYITSNTLYAELLTAALGRKVTTIPKSTKEITNTFRNSIKDSLLTQLMVISDNFIAEQLMVQVGLEKTDTASVKHGIRYTKAHLLPNFPQAPKWVDGSGLSRYNLITPEDLVYVLEKMYNEIPHEKLLSYFPVGGKSGTLKKWYANDKPYVFAKSGTLSNNYNLSGYLITKKGNWYIFSLMNNHYKGSSSDRKEEMARILKRIYDRM